MFFELVTLLRVEFIQQVSFRHFLANHYVVVHDLSLHCYKVVSCHGQTFQAVANSGGSSPIFLRYKDLNDCLARCSRTRKYSRSTPNSRHTSSLSRSSRNTSRNNRRSRSDIFSRISRTFLSICRAARILTASGPPAAISPLESSSKELFRKPAR